MNADSMIPNLSVLAARWWMPVVRGGAALLFGVLTNALPQISLFTLVVLFSAYAFVDGGFAILQAVRAARAGKIWAWLLAEGAISVAAGGCALAWPGVTVQVLLIVITAWAILTGAARIAAASRLRRQLSGEWQLAASGVVAIAFGVLLPQMAGAGAPALASGTGGFTIIFGALLIGVGWRLKRWRSGGDRPFLTGGEPTHA